MVHSSREVNVIAILKPNKIINALLTQICLLKG